MSAAIQRVVIARASSGRSGKLIRANLEPAEFGAGGVLNVDGEGANDR